MATSNARKVERELPQDIPSMSIPDSESPFTSDGKPPMGSIPELPELPKSKNDTELILDALLKSYVGIGTAVTLFSPPDGFLIIQNAEDLTESWRGLLDNDPKLRRTMKKFIQGSGWGAVISAHLMIAIPIVNNHRDGFSHLIKRSTPSSAE